MSDKDKERAIAEIVERSHWVGKESAAIIANAAYDAGEKAGRKDGIEDAAKIHDLTQMVRALMDDWTVERTSLHDEEGVEGWCWTSPDGDEFYEIGNWDELPPWPDGANEKLGEKP